MKFVEGQIIKNVKELGVILGKEVKTKVQTKTKNSWLKELDTYCTWHKEGQKIIIDEVFTEQKEKVDGRKNNGKGKKYSYYADYIDKLILHTLYKNNGDFSFTLKTLFTEEIKLFNKDGINDLYNASDKYIKKTFNVNSHWNQQFMYIFRNIYTDMFKSSCKRLEKKEYIEYYKDYMYVEHGSPEKQSMNDKEQIEKVKQIETEVKENMGVKNVYLNNEVYTLWNEECTERIRNEVNNRILSYWSCYTLYQRAEDEEMYESYHLEQEEVDRLTKELTKTILWRLHEKLQSYEVKQKQHFGEDIIYKPYQCKNILNFVLKAEQMIFNIDTKEEVHEKDKTIFTTPNETLINEPIIKREKRKGLTNKINNDNIANEIKNVTYNIVNGDNDKINNSDIIIDNITYDMYDESLLPF